MKKFWVATMTYTWEPGAETKVFWVEAEKDAYVAKNHDPKDGTWVDVEEHEVPSA